MTTYQEISAQFYSNRLLFGDPADPGVVAVEVASKTELDVYKRLSGKLTRERRPIRLFALVENCRCSKASRRRMKRACSTGISGTRFSSPSTRWTLWKPPGAI